MEDELRHQALHDALTGLPNRAWLHERLEQAIREAKCDGHGLALLLLDLDRFKDFNDTFGHRHGDAILRETSRRLRAAARSGDIVARLGGDDSLLCIWAWAWTVPVSPPIPSAVR